MRKGKKKVSLKEFNSILRNAPDVFAPLDTLIDSDISKIVLNFFGSTIGDKNRAELTTILCSWKNPRAAFFALQELSRIKQEEDTKRVNIERMIKAFRRFEKDIEKSGFNQTQFFPHFNDSLRKTKQTFAFDLDTFISKPRPYSLRKKGVAENGVVVFESAIASGQPGNLRRDLGIAALVRHLRSELKLKSQAAAVNKAFQLLKLIGFCHVTEARIGEIANEEPPVVKISGPTIDVKARLLNKSFS